MVEPPSPVVGAAVVRAGRLLAARRTAPPALAGRWELPGGKIEPGEDPRDALRRELAEELGIGAARVGAEVGAGWPLPGGGLLYVFLVTLGAGDEPRLGGDHDALAWLDRAAAWGVPWLDADRPAVSAVLALLDGDDAGPSANA